MTLTYTYDGAALTHNIAPSTVSLPSSAEEGDPSFGGLNIEDPDADLELLGHRPFVIEESACSQPRIWTGWTTERGIGRAEDQGMFGDATARIHDVTIVDLNALFTFRMISGTDAKRPEETWDDRLAWILGSDYLAGLIEDTGYLATYGRVMDAADYTDGYPADVMRDLLDRKTIPYSYWAFWDPVAAAVGLYIGPLDEAIGDSTLRISNVVADIDSTTTFAPDPEARLAVTPTETWSEVVVEYGHSNKRLFRSRASTATKYIRRGTKITRPYTGTQATASFQAECFLDQHENEQDRITVTIIVPASKVGLLRAGQRMDVKFSHLTNYTSFTSMRVVRLTITPVDDLARYYSMALELLAPRPSTVAAACEIMGYDHATLDLTVPITDTPTGFISYNSSYGRTGDYVCPTPSGLVYYPSSGAAGTNSRPHPTTHSNAGEGGGWSFANYGAAKAGMPTGYADGGSAIQAGGKLKIWVVGPGTATVWMTSVSPSEVHLYAVDMPDATHPAFDVYTLVSTTAGTYPSTTVVVPADGSCAHAIIVDDISANQSALFYGGFDWVAGETDVEVDLPPPPGAPITSTADPTVDDDAGDAYQPGQTWINTTTGQTFVLVDNTTGAAVWVQTGLLTLDDLTDVNAPSPVAGDALTWTGAAWEPVRAVTAWKAPVRVATVAAGTLATSFENGDTVGGVVLATGDRILIKDQADATENGIYVVAASGAPARAYDMDVAAEFPGAWVPVLEGSVNHGTLWRCTLATAPTVGTTSVHFAQFAGAAGGGALYAIDAASGVGTYQVLSFTPDTAAEELDTVSVAAADGEKLIDAYITAAGVPGVTVIPSGSWEFHTYRKVDNASGDSRIVYRVYKYAVGGAETLLFTVTGEEINDTTVNTIPVEALTTQPDFAVADTDRLLIKVYGKTTSVAARTITYYHSGTTHYSHVETPLHTAGGGSMGALDDVTDVNAPAPNNGDVLTWDSTPGEWVPVAPGAGGGDTVGQIVAGWHGGGAELEVGTQVDVVAPFTGTITGWTLLADQTGDAVVDVWVEQLVDYPPTNADSITAAAPPTLTAHTDAASTAVGTWTAAITAGDVVRFNLDSVTDCTRLLCVLDYSRP